ncbi:MAG: hypothetical protein JWM97_3086 [Phycisphaerales bacterium]|nr:hypothetical protein [Phycisphaerales bacterium]
MAKKSTVTSQPKAVSAPAKIAAPAIAATTPVRNSAVPPKAAVAIPAKKGAPTRDQIAQRAYFIWQSGTGGSEYDNWTRAERELRGI